MEGEEITATSPVIFAWMKNLEVVLLSKNQINNAEGPDERTKRE